MKGITNETLDTAPNVIRKCKKQNHLKQKSPFTDPASVQGLGHKFYKCVFTAIVIRLSKQWILV